MANEITIAVPDVADLGPKMQACSELERRFVVAYFATGQREKAAHAAGYAGDPGSNLMGVQAYRVWHRPRVQEAIREFAEKSVFAGLVPLAMKAVENALMWFGDKTAVKAAEMVLDRTGFHSKQEMTVTHVDESRVEQIKRIVAMARAQGLDPRKLIGGAVDFVDADFEALDEEPSTAGIEDIL